MVSNIYSNFENMNIEELENIWSRQESTAHKNEFSLDEIEEATLKFSSEPISSGKRMIRFDSIFKGIVMAAYLLLIPLGSITPVRISVIVLILLCLSYLMYRNYKLKYCFASINEAKPIIEVLQQRYDGLKRYYSEFIFSFSITNFFLVFAGFQFYLFFRYGEDRFYQLVQDPVIFLFLVAAFLIPFVAYKVLYAGLVNEMERLLDLQIDEVDQQLNIIELQAKRRNRKVILATLTMIGLALFIIFLFFSS